MTVPAAILKTFIDHLAKEAVEKRSLRLALAASLAGRNLKSREIPPDFDDELASLLEGMAKVAVVDRNIQQRLRQIAEILAPKAKGKRRKATTSSHKKPAAVGSKRAPSPFDPIAKALEGNSALFQALTPLEVKQLQAMVIEFGMDPDGKVRKWKTHKKLVDHIVEAAAVRRDRGSAFLR